jgi:hypothetical protein
LRRRIRHRGGWTGERPGHPARQDAWRDYVAREYSLETGLNHVYLDSLFDRAIHEVGPISHLMSGLTAADLALLRGLATLFDGCTYFEIAERRSESLANMADVARECCVLHRPVAEMRKKGVRNKYMYLMGSYSRAFDNVVFLSGDPATFDFTSLGRKFDIAFINSGHEYERVLTSTRKTMEYIIHDKSIVVWHEYSYFPEQIRYEVLAAILDGTDPARREQLSFVSSTKCAILLP